MKKKKCIPCPIENCHCGGEFCLEHGKHHCPPTPKQDKPQEEYRMTEICPKCGKSTSTRITSAEQERDEILNSKELRVSPLCKDCQPPQKEGRENDTYTYEETLETVKKLSKLMQKEGCVCECHIEGCFCSECKKDKCSFWVESPPENEEELMEEAKKKEEENSPQ